MSRIPGGRACESDFPDFQELNDELPDDIADDEKYIEIPDRQELGLGKSLVLDFAREFLPNDFEEVRYILGKRGAYVCTTCPTVPSAAATWPNSFRMAAPQLPTSRSSRRIAFSYR